MTGESISFYRKQTKNAPESGFRCAVCVAERKLTGRCGRSAPDTPWPAQGIALRQSRR